MRNRTIGVISLVGAEQAEHIRARLSETIGEEIMQRHSILCGDSATFQGSERDIVYLSMVADSANKTALTMLRYEQRFNVAVSRARDRVVLVRSVKREELNPNDLKARLIAHFENPMPELEEIEDALAVCELNFERDLMERLLERGYRVQGKSAPLDTGSIWSWRAPTGGVSLSNAMATAITARAMAARHAPATRSRTGRLALLALLCVQLLPRSRTAC